MCTCTCGADTITSTTVILFLVILPTIQYKPVGNYFPSCLEIIDVYPYPHSTLKPVGDYGSTTVYSIQVTFSKAISSYTRKRLSTFILTPLLSEESRDVSTKFVKSWRGSERKFSLLFHVNQTGLNTQ